MASGILGITMVYAVFGFIVAYRIEINIRCRHHARLRVQDYILIMLLWPYIVLVAYARQFGEYIKKWSRKP